MLISKFDLYKPEWLELVFAKRNKDYGAYELRQHYAGNLIKAMVITFVSVISAAVIFGIVIKAKPVTEKIIEVTINPFVNPPVTPPKVEPPKPKPAEPIKASAPVQTTRYVEMVVTSQPVTVDPPKMSDLLNTAVGPETIKVPGGDIAINAAPDAGKGGGGTETGAGEDTKVHDMSGLDAMPTPFGGESAWGKFLQKNLKYPPQASENEKSGKVWISFIIEKDGHLSDITLLRGPGYGMDDEAMRVLKLAPAWKPGKQNGQPVRVKYTIPINFSIGE